MFFNTVIPYTSSVGSKFLINFKDFSIQDFSLPVVDVSLLLVEPTEAGLSLRDLIALARIIKSFLNENKVVLYYYCDTSASDIFISQRNKKMQPQKFRHSLFNVLFDLMKVTDFVKDEIIIDDPTNNTHYITLITKVADKSSLTEVSIAVQKMNDK